MAIAYASAAADPSAALLPQYHLKVGQELVYHEIDDTRFASGGNKNGSTKDWQLWVVRQHEDGSWRVVVGCTETNWYVDANGKRVDGALGFVLGSYDLFPDGRLSSQASLDNSWDPRCLLPRLPKDPLEITRGWSEEADGLGNSYRFNADAKATTGNLWSLDAVRESPEDTGWDRAYHYKISFDASRGLTKRATVNGVIGWGSPHEESGTVELKEVKEHDAQWTARFAAESEEYLVAAQAHETLTDQIMKETKNARKLLADAENVLKDARAKLTFPMLQKLADNDIKGHTAWKNTWIDEANYVVAMTGKPAATWSAKDLDGKTHSLKDYRGKVVILDFCHRACGWCLIAMPHLKQMVDDFKNEPVVVLGMSNDHNEEDARFVFEKMKLNYPLLFAPELPKEYGVTGFPTLFVVDQAGVIRDVEIGYTPTFRENVTRTVKDLLNGSSKRAE